MKKRLQKFLGTATLLLIFVLAFGLTALAAPKKVTGLKQTEAYASSAYFSWDAVVGENIKYQVEWSDNKVTWATVTQNGTLPKNGISGVSAGKIYYVRVAAKEGYNGALGQWSDILEVVTRPENINTNTVKQTNATKNSVTLQWGAAAGATAYRIYTYDSGSIGAERATVTGTAVTLSGLQEDNLYRFAIIPETSTNSFKAVGSGIYILTRTVPGKIDGIETQYINKNSVGLRFNRKNTTDGYEIQVYNNNGKKKVGKIIRTTSSYVTLNKVKASSFYQIKIRSFMNLASGKKYSDWTVYQTANQPYPEVKRSGSSIKLSWKRVAGATSYTVYGKKGKTVSAQRKAFKKIGTTKSNKYTVTKIGKAKLKKGTNYGFFVVANKKVKGKTYQSVAGYSRGGVL